MRKLWKAFKAIIGFPFYIYRIYIINKRILHTVSQNYLQIESLLSLYSTLDIDFLPRTRSWAASPDFLSEVSQLILRKSPKFIFEISSGVSTIIIGKSLLKNESGHSISIENNEGYLEDTKQNIRINHIEEISKVLHAPLKKYELDCGEWLWYDIDDLKLEEKIDMLIIDGPVGSIQQKSRYPAVPLLFQFLSDQATIILDDSNRQDEKAILEEWKNFLQSRKRNFIFTTRNEYEKGMAIIELY